MKKSISLILVISLITILSCRKDYLIISNSGCPEQIDLLSRPYINPYTGTLHTGSAIPPDLKYLDKYVYKYPCSNPNNDYEFCYLRREVGVQFEDDMDLYKFDFCTGNATLITKHVAYGIDWGAKNWIIFTGINRELWKIKADGDSLTQLTFLSPYPNKAKWSKDGTKFIYNGLKIADENGKFLFNLPFQATSCAWKNNEEIICMDEKAKQVDIYVQNIKTLSRNNLTSIACNGGGGYIQSFFNNNAYIWVENQDNSGTRKHYKYNIDTKDTTLIFSTTQSLDYNLGGSIGERFITQLSLTDTMTGTPILLNYRSHLAIMNIDGTNKRQVMIPE